MYDRLPIKQRHLSIMENGETVVDLDKRRARMIAQGKRATNSSVTSPDNV